MVLSRKIKQDNELLGTAAERLKYILMLLRFKSYEFNYILERAQKKLTFINHAEQLKSLGIPEATLRKWETGRRSLTNEGIERCIEAFKKLGVIVSKNWLKNGNGIFPFIESNPELEQLKLIDNDLKIFFSYLDKNQRFIYIGNGYSQLFNLPVSKIVGKSLSELLSPSSYEKQKDILEQVYAGKTVEFEYPWEYAPDTYQMLRICYAPDFDRDKKVRGIFSFLQVLEQYPVMFDKKKSKPRADNIQNMPDFDLGLTVQASIVVEKLLRECGLVYKLDQALQLVKEICMRCKVPQDTLISIEGVARQIIERGGADNIIRPFTDEKVRPK